MISSSDPISGDVDESRLAEHLLDVVRQQLISGLAIDESELRRQFPGLSDQISDLVVAARGFHFLDHLQHGPPCEADHQRPSSVIDPAIKQIGDYELVRPIGRGGMGVVYEAIQMSLNRPVALKIMSFVGLLDDKHLQRFRNEALAAASLDHPHIVHAYSFGQDRGVYYFAMKLIDGRNLAEILKDLRNNSAGNSERDFAPTRSALHQEHDSQDSAVWSELSVHRDTSADSVLESEPTFSLSSATDSRSRTRYFREITELFRQAAEALEYAHQRGVVHRDIKPSNLIIDAHRHLWIADFGLAQIEHGADLTTSGDILGTLRYSSPEQAMGQPTTDHRTDIYSLGITFYEALTKQPAFSESDRSKLLSQILGRDPKRPRQVDPLIPSDLETIILKAIAKEAKERYETAAAMAEDLRRFLSGRPLLTRRPTWYGTTWRWIKRNPRVSLLGGALLTVLVVSTIVFTFQGRYLLGTVEQLNLSNARLEQAIEDAGQAQHRAELISIQQAELLYAAMVGQVARLQQQGEYEQSMQYLEQTLPLLGNLEPGAFELDWLRAQHHRKRELSSPHQNEVFIIQASSDGTWLAMGDRDGRVTIWDAKRLRVLREFPLFPSEVNRLAFAPDNSQLAVACRGTLYLFDTETWQLQRSIVAHDGTMMFVSYSQDGNRLFTAARDGLTKAWQMADLALLWTHTNASGQAFTCGELSPDGRHVAVGGHDKRITLLSAETGEVQHQLLSHIEPILALSYSPTGEHLASGGYGNQLLIWDTKQQEVVQTLLLDSSIVAIEFDPTGQHLAFNTRGHGTLIYQADGGWNQAKLKRRLSNDGQDLKALRWQLPSSTKAARLLTANASGQLFDWWIPTDGREFRTSSETSPFRRAKSLAIGVDQPSGELALQVGTEYPGQLFNASHHEYRLTEAGPRSEDDGELIVAAQFGPRVVVKNPQTFEIWELENDQWHRKHLVDLPQPCEALSLSADARWLATVANESIELWDCDNGTRRSRWQLPAAGTCVAFSRDNSLLAVGCASGDVQLHSLSNHRDTLLSAKSERSQPCKLVRFNASGSRLVTGSEDRRVVVWEVATAAVVSDFRVDGRPIDDLALSPDGLTLAVASDHLRLWRLTIGMPLMDLFERPLYAGVYSYPFRPIQFSEDGRYLVVATKHPPNIDVLNVLDSRPFEDFDLTD